MAAKVKSGTNDLATLYPDLALEWHPTKNGDLTPSDVFAGTNRKVWWQCAKGHEWEAIGNSRSRGRGCPYCSGRFLLAGLNDLATTHPDLALEWHPTKNGDLTPSDVFAGTNRKVWWQCAKGHEWQSTGINRVNGQGCPTCSNQRVLQGFNDLATLHPCLALEWHPTKNGDLTPSDVIAGTNRKVWWQCAKGHEWLANNANRVLGRGCPICAGKQVLAGYNDLATTQPELALEWHPTNNADLTPSGVVSRSNAKVWWQCTHGHVWQATVNARTGGKGCAVCAGQIVLEGFNDLATLYPELALEWHPTKNGDLTPSEVMGGTSKRVWWRCQEGHEWLANGANRINGRGCPSCASFGFDPSKPAVLYFLYNPEYRARKVGITNVGTTRLLDFSRIGWDVVYLVEAPNGHSVPRVERAVFQWLREDHRLPFYLGREEMGRTGGWTETFSLEGPSDAEIIARIEAEFAKLEQSN
jgi:hypothetical protein